MKLIIGLGNPEPAYDLTRHNVGFLLLDHVADQQSAPWREKPRLKGVVAETVIGNEKAILLKPTTYYNISGEAARAVMDFYKLQPEDVLVLHDELALPFGTLRTRLKGSDAGNNGIKSLIAHIGGNFARIRVGIWNERAAQQDAADFVLGRFSTNEQDGLNDIARQVLSFIEDFVHHEKEFAPTSVDTKKDRP